MYTHNSNNFLIIIIVTKYSHVNIKVPLLVFPSYIHINVPYIHVPYIHMYMNTYLIYIYGVTS